MIEQYAGQRVLVTGASGFIGTALCRRLIQSGAEVHAVSRRTPPGEADGMRWWQGDLADADVTQTLIATVKPDVVFHLASRVTGSRERALVLPTFQSNLVSTVNLMSALAEHGCRSLVLAGSMEEPLTNEEPPRSPYAAAKWAASGYARMFFALYGLPVAIARIFMVYGPAQQERKFLIPYVTACLLRGEPPQLTSGDRLIDWVFVEDVVDGLLMIGVAPGAAGNTIEIGSGELVSVRRVVEHLVRLENPGITPRFGVLAARPMEHSRVADMATTYAQIGWQPTTSLESGLSQTVAWYREHQEASGGRRQ